MSKNEILALQATFVARLETMAAFLGTAMDFIIAANHPMTEDEKAGFHYCVEELRHNAKGVVETGEILQEMEVENG